MRILVKAPLALGLLIALYTVAMFVAGRYFIIPSFQNAQISSARRNLDRVMAAIDREGNYLAALGNSRSVADAADAVLPTEARTFLKQTGVDLIAVYAEDGALRFEARYDRQNDEVRPEALLPGPAPHDAPYVHHSGSTENIVGFIDSPQGVYIVASAPILRPGGSGRIRGSLVIGRLIDAAFSSDIQRQTSVHAQLEPVRFSRGVDPNALLKAGGRKVVVGDHGREIVAYGVESDLWGSPVLIVRAHISQEIGVWSRQTFRISVVMMLALALVFSAIQLTFLLRAVVRPLGMLQDHVREYEKDEAKSLSWSVSQRRDEIGGLAVAFEHMGQSLSLKRRELVSANETLEAKVEERTAELRKAGEDLRLLANVVESTGSSVVITDLVGRILKVNEAFCETSGYAEAELLGKNPRIMKSGRHDEKFYKEFWQRLTSQGTWQGEIWDRRKDGGIFPKWLTVNLVRDERGSPRCYVGVSSDLSSLKAAEERLRELAYFDPLTSLPNRSLFLDRLEHGVLHGLRYGDRQALLFIDLDRFKYVNEALGHHSGDQLLVEVARRITRRVRKSDTVCRLGGDEFTVILEELRRSEDAGAIAQSIIEELGKPFTVNGREVFIGASIGIAVCPEDDATAEGLARKAEAAMYQAKAAGRNSFRFVSRETDAVSQARLAMEAELRRAVERAEFVLHYQPIVELRTARVLGAEALVRWRRPGEVQLVPPASFISLAEETGTIFQMGSWVLKASCAQAARWRAEGHPLGISVNVSARQFSHAGLVRDVASALAETGLPAELLVIELTESAVMADVDAAQRTMGDLKNLGVSIAIDDFGTGYSSLSYLCRFPVDRLKIDQSFVRGIGSAPRMDALADAIIAMARSLGIALIAEGVETPDQRAFLASRGCLEGQGYLFSKPIPSDEFLLFARSAPLQQI